MKVEEIKEKIYKSKKYLNMIKLETPSKLKIQLTIAINFISSKDSDEAHTMHTESNNVEIIVGSETDEIIGELFDSILKLHQEI